MIVKKNVFASMLLFISFISILSYAKSENKIFTKYRIENSDIAVTQNLIQENVLSGEYTINAKVSYKNSDYIEQIENDIIPRENIIINGKNRSTGYYQKSKSNIDKVKIQFKNLQYDKMLDFNKFILDYRLVPEDLHTSVDFNIYLKNANNEKMIATTMIAGSDELYSDEIIDVAGKEWIAKDNIYLLKRELNFGFDDKWRYAQDGNRMVVQQRFNKKINTLKYINIEVDAKYTLSMVNLLVGKRENEKYDQIVNWERLKREEISAGDVIQTRIDAASLVHDTLLRYEDVYLKEIVIFIFGDQEVISAKAIRNIEFFKFLALNPEYKGQEVINIESMHMMKNKGTRKFIVSLDRLKDWYEEGFIVDDIDMLIRMNTNNKSGGIHIDDIMYSNVNVSKISKINQNNCLMAQHLGYVDKDLYLDPTDCIKIRQVYPYSYLSLKDNYKNNQLPIPNFRIKANKNAAYNVDIENDSLNLDYYFTDLDDSVDIEISAPANIKKNKNDYDISIELMDVESNETIKNDNIYNESNSVVKFTIQHEDSVNIKLDNNDTSKYKVNSSESGREGILNNDTMMVDIDNNKNILLKISPLLNPHERESSALTGKVTLGKLIYKHTDYKKVKEKRESIFKYSENISDKKHAESAKNNSNINDKIKKTIYRKDLLSAIKEETKNKVIFLPREHCVRNLKANICSDYPLRNVKFAEESLEFNTTKNTAIELNIFKFPENIDHAYMRYSILDGYEYITDSTVKLLYKTGEEKVFRVKPSKNMLLHNTKNIKSAKINIDIQENAFIKLSNVSVFNIEKDIDFNPLTFPIISPYAYNLDIDEYEIISNSNDVDKILDTSTSNKLQLLTSLQENDPLIIKWTTPVNIPYADIKKFALHYELPSNVFDDDAALTMEFTDRVKNIRKEYSIDKPIGSIHYSLIDDIDNGSIGVLEKINWTLVLTNKAIDISKWEQIKLYTIVNRIGLTNAYEIYKNLSLFEIDGKEYSIANINDVLNNNQFDNMISINNTYRSTGTVRTINLIDNLYFNIDNLTLEKVTPLPYQLLGTISMSADDNAGLFAQGNIIENSSPHKIIYFLMLIGLFIFVKLFRRVRKLILLTITRSKSFKENINRRITNLINILSNWNSTYNNEIVDDSSEITEKIDNNSLPLNVNAIIGYACMLAFIWRIIHIGKLEFVEYLLIIQIVICGVLNAKLKGVIIQKKAAIRILEWVCMPNRLLVMFLSYMTIVHAVFYTANSKFQWMLFVLPIIYSTSILAWVNNQAGMGITKTFLSIIKLLCNPIVKIFKLLMSINYLTAFKLLFIIAILTLIFIMSLTSGTNNTINDENYYFTMFAIAFVIAWRYICSIIISLINKFIDIKYSLSYQGSSLYYMGFVIFIFTSILLNFMDMGVFSGYSAIVSYFMLIMGIYYKIIDNRAEKEMTLQQ